MCQRDLSIYSSFVPHACQGRKRKLYQECEITIFVDMEYLVDVRLPFFKSVMDDVHQKWLDTLYIKKPLS